MVSHLGCLNLFVYGTQSSVFMFEVFTLQCFIIIKLLLSGLFTSFTNYVIRPLSSTLSDNEYCVLMKGHRHVWPWLFEFSDVVPSYFML